MGPLLMHTLTFELLNFITVACHTYKAVQIYSQSIYQMPPKICKKCVSFLYPHCMQEFSQIAHGLERITL